MYTNFVVWKRQAGPAVYKRLYSEPVAVIPDIAGSEHIQPRSLRPLPDQAVAGCGAAYHSTCRYRPWPALLSGLPVTAWRCWFSWCFADQWGELPGFPSGKSGGRLPAGPDGPGPGAGSSVPWSLQPGGGRVPDRWTRWARSNQSSLIAWISSPAMTWPSP